MPSGEKRAKRVRLKLRGITRQSGLPRLTVFRSNRYIYAQIIDDQKRETLLSASNQATCLPARQVKQSSNLPAGKAGQAIKGKIEIARGVGKALAEQALKKGIKKVIFDRGSYKYHGRVKALAEGAREGGLNF